MTAGKKFALKAGATTFIRKPYQIKQMIKASQYN